MDKHTGRDTNVPRRREFETEKKCFESEGLKNCEI